MRQASSLTAILALLLLIVPADPLFASHVKPTAIAPSSRLRYQPEAHNRHAKPEAHRVRPEAGRRRVARARVRAEAPVRLSKRERRKAITRDRHRIAASAVPVRERRKEAVVSEAVLPPSEAVGPVMPATNVEDVVKPLDPVEDALVAVSGLYDGRGRLNMPAALKGSHEILVRQNQIANLDGLARIQDDEDLLQMRQRRMLVPIPVSEGLRIDERLPENRRFCRPWVARFLVALGRAHYAQFHVPLQVNSAVRTVSFQLQLMRTNGNAAPANGETASPHLTGQAIDIAKKGLSQSEIAWLRLYLTPLLEDGKIDVEEEFQQACFHVSVYKKYASLSANAPRIASTHRPITPALATTLE